MGGPLGHAALGDMPRYVFRLGLSYVGWGMKYIIWYQTTETGLYSRVEVTRLDDAQAVWDMLAARGRLMRSPRP